MHVNLGNSNRHCGPRNRAVGKRVRLDRAVTFNFHQGHQPMHHAPTSKCPGFLVEHAPRYHPHRSGPWTAGTCSTSSSEHSRAPTPRFAPTRSAAGRPRDRAILLPAHANSALQP